MRIKGMNRELESANDFLATLSMKISRYISPQVCKGILSGQKDVTIHTERKKLLIFFSDIQNFTATTERLQPELITQLLNQYFTEISAIAHDHRGTIDKFIGDAMLIFFDDPETRATGQMPKPACGWGSGHDVDVRSDLHLFVQLDDVRVVHAKTAMRDGAADRAGPIGAVNSV
jgi:class 3 adenylate cyclase